ncbi:hypothetical protein LQ953_14905 [Sphingomonas sp. IC-56]|uniref:hypothetical protein n=1 Tax=Sphingomonas sp. IC-56 TaxID=2898529 RepID=UPI001E39F5CC|nr:hypothetical protein [Sphingomonas sp. IC-56]MCD2325310.1 hypothetical protein [Sphingomonas sp. IC-56]
MTPYAEVDPVIEAWAQVTVKELFTEWADRPARSAYLSGLRPLECFQISIGPPVAGHIAVWPRSVDTDDDSEFEQRWEDTTEAHSALLAADTASGQLWASRKTADVS